ncbi:hypothetical protein BDV28DRAFT_143790 [Aspergillus coremiiformis]|uniref:Uncharacterized protein n=1 Tax=Aspergillus coremiiformis TaxID=138285 RepID=A0A5N6YSC6_9EURO|nr:hypothetical protein BDV28DRAFT_143790 [Aspergillus coremiiformis]
MSVVEPPERRKLRKALRALYNRIQNLEVYGFDLHQGKAYDINILPMELEEQSDSRPYFFTPCSASLLLDPVESTKEEGREFHDFDSFLPNHRDPMNCARWLVHHFDGYISNCITYSDGKGVWELAELLSRISIGDPPFRNMHQFTYPEWVITSATQLTEGPQPHIKAFIFNNMNGTDENVLRGEVMVALNLMIQQLRFVRFIEQLTAPILLFSFMGPQHARLVEAYFDGTSLVMRLTRLFDLRKMDPAVTRMFGQWFFGLAIGDTTKLWNAESQPFLPA